MSDVTFKGDLTGYRYVGGVAGNIKNDNIAKFSNLNIDVSLNIIGHNQNKVALGGLAGKVEGVTQIKVEKAIDGKESTFDVVVSTDIYVYGESVVLNVGAILAEDESLVLHEIEHTISNLTGTCKVEDMSQVFDTREDVGVIENTAKEDEEPVYKFVRKADGEILDDAVSGLIFAKRYLTESPDANKTYCSIKLISSSGRTDNSFNLNVNLSGEYYIPNKN